MADGRVQFIVRADVEGFTRACQRVIDRLHLVAVVFGFYTWRRRGAGG